jgi:membrane protein required for colicin V production
VNALDWIVVLILGLSTLRGLMRGMVDTLFSMAAWFLAFIAGKWGATLVEPLLPAGIDSPNLRYFAGFAVVFLLVLLAVMLLGYALATTLRAMGLGTADKLLGGVVGFAKGAMIVVGFTLVAGLTSLPRTDFWHKAATSHWLEMAARFALPLLPVSMSKYVKFNQ